jgi:hypothetical protein
LLPKVYSARFVVEAIVVVWLVVFREGTAAPDPAAAAPAVSIRDGRTDMPDKGLDR